MRRWCRDVVDLRNVGVAGAGPFRYASVADVPARPVALVLGNRAYPDGTVSRLLAGRLDLAYRLFQAGKVETILVSGDASGRKVDGDPEGRHAVPEGRARRGRGGGRHPGGVVARHGSPHAA